MDTHDVKLLKTLTNTIKFTFLDKSIFDNNFEYVDKLYAIFLENPCEKLINKKFVMPEYKYEKDKFSTYIEEFNIYDDKIIQMYLKDKYNINKYNDIIKNCQYCDFTPFFLQVCKLILLLTHDINGGYRYNIQWLHILISCNKNISCPKLLTIFAMEKPYVKPSAYNYIINPDRKYYKYNILAATEYLKTNGIYYFYNCASIDLTYSYVQSYDINNIILSYILSKTNILDNIILLKSGCLNVAKFIIDNNPSNFKQNAILLLLQIGRYFPNLKDFIDNKNDLLAIFNMEYMGSKLETDKMSNANLGSFIVIQYLNTMVNSNDIYVKYYKNKFSYTEELLYIALKNFQYDIICDIIASGLQINIKHIIYFYDNIVNLKITYTHYIKNKLEILENILFLLVNNINYTISDVRCETMFCNAGWEEFVPNVLELISSSHFTTHKKFKSMFIRILLLKNNLKSIITYDLLKVAARKGLYFKNLEIPYDNTLYNIYYPYYIPLYYLKRFPNKEEIIKRSYGNLDHKIWNYFGMSNKKRDLITSYSGYHLQKLYETNRALYNKLSKKVIFEPVTNTLYDYEYLAKYYT